MTKQEPGQFQRIITALAASILVFYLWVFLYQKFWYEPPQTQPAGETAAIVPATDPMPGATLPSTQPSPTATGPDGGPAAFTAPASADGQLAVVGGETSEPIRLGNAAKDSPFPMALELTPRGAAIAEAWLRGYYQTVDREMPYRIFQPLIDNGNTNYSLETPRIRFVDFNTEVRLDRVLWNVEAAEEERVVFSVRIDRADGEPLARVVKTYALPPQPPKPGDIGETHDMLLTLAIENLTGGPLRAVIVQQGPLGFEQATVRQEDRAVVIATYEQGQKLPAAEAHYRKSFADKELLELGGDEDNRRIAWVAEANQYFTCVMAPANRTSAADPLLFDRVDAVHLIPRAEATSEDMSFRFITAPLTVAAGQSEALAFDCYIGPKSKKLFEAVEKYEARNYYAVITTSFYACAPTALVSIMMGLLNFFYRIPPHNYGIAIFLLVILVRTILHPITKKSQVNMMKMQKQMATLQPKVNAVREKYANDKAAMNQAMMEVYREAGVNPAGNILTCIPLMLQLPIWAALWAALNSMVEMRHAPLDGWWIKDLTQPDALIPLPFAFEIPLIGMIMGGPITAINLLPLLLGVSQILQARFMPRSTAPANPDKPDQMDQQRKMMMFMSVFFVFMFYNMPSGLNLYIMTSNFAGIIEQWRIRKHIEEEEKKGPILPAGPKPKSWLTRKWEQLQKEAEEARRLQSERPKRKK